MTAVALMGWLDREEVFHLLATYGYMLIAVMVAVEGIGIPVPGETTLLVAAVTAGTSHRLSLWGVIAAAILGALVGDNTGFWLGRWIGYRLLLRFGGYVGLTER